MWTFLLASTLLGSACSDGPPPPPPPRATETLRALHCPPCEQIHCTPRRALRLQCRGGITTGICGCCPTCARTAGEACGGAWDYLGKCDKGLACVYQDPEDGKGAAERAGLCQAVLEPLGSDSCLPECTREYCRDNPTAICSARLVSLDKKECHGSCQHTSCAGCLLLKSPPCAQACAPAEASCLQRFGRCVRGHLAAPRHAACHQDVHSHAEGYFVCLTPTCPVTLN